jgi:hypothetical protein
MEILIITIMVMVISKKIFGVYTEKDAAEVAKDLVTKEL